MKKKKSTYANAFARVRKYAHLTERMGAGTIALLTVGIITAAMLIGAHRSAQRARTVTMDSQPENTATQAEVTAANAPAVESATKTPAPKSASVTITGCLERTDDATFRLKDTSGTDAPRSRSWKSGFLKKGPASVEVVDGRNRVKLPNHVGQRVSVTGTLVDHEMQVRSLQRVAASCTNNPRVRI